MVPGLSTEKGVAKSSQSARFLGAKHFRSVGYAAEAQVSHNLSSRDVVQLSERCRGPWCGPGFQVVSNLRRELRPIGTYVFTDEPHFEGAAFANCITGCTCVFNRPLLALLKPLPQADAVLMHDWWLYLVGAAFGRVVYDPVPGILYRQHSTNQVGLRRGGIGALLYRTRQSLRRGSTASRLTQAREFLRVYGGRVSAGQRELLEALIACERAPIRRLCFAISRGPRRREALEEIVCFTECVMGWF